MKIVPDTNVLLRAVLGDDARRSHSARAALRSAEQVILSRHALCELVWVLIQRYKISRRDVAKTIQTLADGQNVVADDAAVSAGLSAMEAGTDFADGLIAYEGAWLGAETFISFDRKAVAALSKQGLKTKLLI
jgi:predicted nucleic-acid-binding protein